jgi:L-threonylcarbamoyladenylate synthase
MPCLVAEGNQAQPKIKQRSRACTLPAEILKISAQSPESSPVEYAATIIERGGVVGCPTDTFYGLAADPLNLSAIQQVYRIKGRPDTKALPILVGSVEQAVTLARDVSEIFLSLAHHFWPGALTIAVEASQKLPLKVTGNSGRVALRWANSPVTWALIAASGGPVTGTSANLSGFPSCTNAAQLARQLGDALPLILDAGETGATLASTIVAIHGDQWSIAREGAIPEADIRAALEQ